MRMRRSLAVALPLTTVAGLITTLSGPASAAVTTAPASVSVTTTIPASLTGQRLSWSECYPDAGYPELQCTSVTVPQDWAKPEGPAITVAVSRIRATDPARRRGVLFTNPGGPGGSGLTLPLFIEFSEPDVSAAYDVIGLDPRGVGSSTELNCGGPGVLDTLYNLDGRDTSPANQARFKQLDMTYAHQCSSDPLTRYINTGQTVRDFDLVRALLREKKISYLGFSFGTWLGAWYASVFPGRVDRFVLDGNIEFTAKSAYSSFRRQPAGFQNSFEHFLQPWIARYNSLYGLGTTPSAVNRTYEKRRAALAAHPLTLTDGSTLTAAGYDAGISGGLYWTGYYDQLSSAMSILEHYSTATADEKQVVTDWFSAGPPGNGDDVFWSVVCQDTRGPGYPELVNDTNIFRQKYPLTGASWNANPCPFFNLPIVGSPIQGAKLPPLLMLNNTDDPATPLANALAARAKTPRASLVKVRQPDHTIYGRGDECADGYVNTYLLKGVLPAGTTSCPGVPLPVPAALQHSASTLKAAAASDGMTAKAWLDEFTAAHGKPKIS